MSNFFIALIFGGGSAFWVYGKFMRSSGSNSKNSLIAAILTGLIVFGVAFIAVGIITSFIDGN